MPVSSWILDILFFLLGFALLTLGADFLIRGASRIAARMNISPVVIGLTIVAFGTSLPELLVSVVANLQPDGRSIAIGNIVGSNIANIGLILGVAAVAGIVTIERWMFRREIPLLVITSVVFIALSWNGSLGLVEGIILAAGLIGFTYYSYTAQRSGEVHPDSREVELEVVESIDPGIGRPSTNILWDIGLIIVGLVGLIFGAEWLVSAAENIARDLGVSDLVIGLTLVAVGTSLPELATTIAAVRKGEADIAIGNVVGSNLFNMLFIGGAAAIIRPLVVPENVLRVDYWVMLAFAVSVYIMAIPRPHRITRWQGGLLLVAYFGYTTWLFVNGAI